MNNVFQEMTLDESVTAAVFNFRNCTPEIARRKPNPKQYEDEQ